MTRKYLYQDIHGDLFKFCSKQKNTIFIQSAKDSNKKYSLNELAFKSLFKETNIEVNKNVLVI